jgi:menaquinone-dependent protoporphyrinogen oxidase
VTTVADAERFRRAKEARVMKVLVAYATRHGGTRGIAERIGQALERPGLEVVVSPADRAPRAADFDAFVVGGAAYAGSWLKEATRFVEANRDLLASHPTWVFSSGPIGTELVDKKGRDVLEASRPSEFAQLDDTIHPREMKVFFGAFDPDAKPIGLMEKLGSPFMHMKSVREAMPAGDFRDWPAIEAWAEEIAAQLESTAAAV